jgi:formate dehydrogenase subunit gamma
MSTQNKSRRTAPPIQSERFFTRFNLAQRWEHTLLLLCVTVLLLTGLPQKYRTASWSLELLSTPHRLDLIRTIHHIAALVLIVEVLYHLVKAIVQLARRKLNGEILPTLQDIRDAGQMLRYLFFLSNQKPKYGKYNFEQKFTYWFLFFSIGLMVITGLLIWFPLFFTRLLPGGIIPAALQAHSTEAIIAGIFIVIWHFYHVHIERLNLSIFTGRLNETEMRTYHAKEYQRLTGGKAAPQAKPTDTGDKS